MKILGGLHIALVQLAHRHLCAYSVSAPQGDRAIASV
jgi:hypothetical protein